MCSSTLLVFPVEMPVRVPGGLPEPGHGPSPASVHQQRCEPAEEDRGVPPQRPRPHPAGTAPGQPARQREDRQDADLRRHPGLPGAHRTVHDATTVPTVCVSARADDGSFFQATIAAAITEKSPFSTPMNRKEEANLAKAALSVANSDHLTIYSAYLGYRLWEAAASL